MTPGDNWKMLSMKKWDNNSVNDQRSQPENLYDNLKLYYLSKAFQVLIKLLDMLILNMVKAWPMRYMHNLQLSKFRNFHHAVNNHMHFKMM